MSSKPLLLEGQVDEDRRELVSLRRELNLLRDEVADMRSAMMKFKSDLFATSKATVRLLSPLYKALQPVFGDMEPIADLTDAPAMPVAKSAVWDSWKSKLGASAAKVIDALLTHGELNTQQLAIAVGLHRTTIPAIIYKLNQAGLIDKHGGKFSLKRL